jgi:hypothetical protein
LAGLKQGPHSRASNIVVIYTELSHGFSVAAGKRKYSNVLVNLLSGCDPMQMQYDVVTAAFLKKLINSKGFVQLDSGSGRVDPDQLQMSDNMTIDLYTTAGIEERVSNLGSHLACHIELCSGGDPQTLL